MTIGTITVGTSGSSTNGATAQFSFAFPIESYGAVDAEDQIKVRLVSNSTGAETVLTRGTNAGQYSVTINGDQSASPGGSITTITTYGSGYKIYIEEAPSFLQATDYQSQGGFLMETVEDQADQHSRQILTLLDRLRRSPHVSVPAGSSFDGEITGPFTAGAGVVLNSGGTGFILGSLSSVAVATAMQSFVQQTSLAAARALLGADYFINVKDSAYGGLGDGTTNDRAAIAAADAVGPVFFPKGTYKVSSNITITNDVFFAPGAKLSIDTGIVVTFSGTIIASPKQQIISGLGTVVLSRKTPRWFPEWWGASASVNSGALIQKGITAATANLVPVHFDGGYPIQDQGITMPPGMGVTCSPDASLNGGSAVANGVTITNGNATGVEHQIPILAGFTTAALRLQGTSGLRLKCKYITGASGGDGVVGSMVNANYPNWLNNVIDVHTIVGCGNAYRITGDNNANVCQGNRFYCNFANTCVNAVFYDASGLSPSWDGNIFDIDGIDPVNTANCRGFKSNLAALNRVEFNVRGWLGGFNTSSGKFVEGAINNMRSRLQFAQAIVNYDMWALTGTGNRVEFLGDNTSVSAIACQTSANNRAAFNSGSPVGSNRMKLSATLGGNVLTDATTTFYAYHPLAGTGDTSTLFVVQAIAMRGFVVDAIANGANANEIAITFRNCTGSTINSGIVIDFYLAVQAL